MTRKLRPPLDSVEPVDWAMYADLLDDTGQAVQAAFARRVAEGLIHDPMRVLVGRVSEEGSLKGNPRRCGRQFFVTGPVTVLKNYCPRWWTAARVRAGLRHWVPDCKEADHEKILSQAHGVPTALPRRPDFFRKEPALVRAFFRSLARGHPRRIDERSRVDDR
jgi:hypothetical protein